MKDRKIMKSGMIWLLLSVLLAIAMVFIQTPAWAVVACPTASTADSDGDGFTDAEECNGITLADGSLFTSLDPNKKDLFVILIRANPSNIPVNVEYDPLEYVKFLPINVHLITETQATNTADNAGDRIVSPTSTYKQKAVRIAETLDTSFPNQMGWSQEGIPGGEDNALIYTQNLINKVIEAYGSISPPGNPNIIPDLIKHTIAHEIGHMIRPLAPISQWSRDYVNFGGFHYKSGTGNILDQSVYYSKSGRTIFYPVGKTFTPEDKAGVTLR